MNTQVWIAILVGLAAVMDDLWRRHIANWIPAAALWTAAVGGILAVCAIGWKALRAWMNPVAAEMEVSPEEKEKAASIPYAPAIALGVWLSLVPKA